MKKRIAIAAAVLVALGVAGHVVWEWPREISGTYQFQGKDAGGHIIFVRGDEQYQVHVESFGRYKTTLPAGHYKVRTWTIEPTASRKSVVIMRGETTVDVVPWKRRYDICVK